MIGQTIKGERGLTVTIEREIGNGSFGTVFLAEGKDKQNYAVKVIAPVTDNAVRLSFRKEIESTFGLKHENLLIPLDVGVCSVGSNEGLFMISEYCAGGDFRAEVSSYAVAPPATEIISGKFMQILSGLSALHTRAIHRDIKPENVLISGGGILKLCDCGLAKFVDEATRTLTFKGGGTRDYMAPEVWKVESVSPATDLYAVGVMIFEAFTGQRPFPTSDVTLLREMHISKTAPRARNLNAKVPMHIDGVIAKLLLKNPRDRFQTAQEVMDAMREPPPATTQASSLAERMRRHKDAEEQKRTERERATEERQREEARSVDHEQGVINLIDGVVEQVNAQSPDVRITKQVSHGGGAIYGFGNRSLHVEFFAKGAMLKPDPRAPGLAEELKKRHVTHGGNLSIVENGELREGWNIALITPPDTPAEWKIVETRMSPFTGRRYNYEPTPTDAPTFAKNLAYHFMKSMHTHNLKDQPLTREEVEMVLTHLIPE